MTTKYLCFFQQSGFVFEYSEEFFVEQNLEANYPTELGTLFIGIKYNNSVEEILNNQHELLNLYINESNFMGFKSDENDDEIIILEVEEGNGDNFIYSTFATTLENEKIRPFKIIKNSEKLSREDNNKLNTFLERGE